MFLWVGHNLVDRKGLLIAKGYKVSNSGSHRGAKISLWRPKGLESY